MKSTLSAKEQPLSKIFSDEYVFTIPGYQRPYAWGPDQAQELLDDLVGYMRGEAKLEDIAPYFLGSIVLIKREAVPEATVVDGQQRLTTLTLLFSAIRSVITDPQVRAGITKRIYEHGDVVTATENHYRVSLRERDRQFFRDYVQHEGGIEKLVALNDRLPDSQARLRANAKLFLDNLAKLNPATLVRLVQFIATRCYLVTVATPDLDSAYRIFGVLNSRGLDLSATDILKAEIIGAIAPAKRDAYTEKWEDLEEELGRDGFSELFSHIRMVYRKAKPQGTVLREFKEHVGPADPIDFIDNVLEPMADAYAEIADADFSSQKHAETINATLRWLNRIEFKDWLPPALAFFARHRNLPDQMLSFFRDLERLAYSMLIRRTGVNERIERFSSLTAAIEGDVDLYAGASPLQLSPKEQFATYEALSGPLYDTHSPRALAVILLRLDGLLSGGGASYTHSVITVEHVLPQQPKSDSEWVGWLPSAQERLFWVHRLGNLALLTRKKNSAASNYDFDRKKAAYFAKGGVSPFPLTTQVLGPKAWTAEVLEERQKQLLAVLEAHWRLQERQSPQVVAMQQMGAAGDQTVEFELTRPKLGLQAIAVLQDDAWVVQAGSGARPWTGADHPYRALHDELVGRGDLQPGNHGQLVFAHDTTFKKPSAASAVILGRPDNGRTSWVNIATGLTFAEWQGGQISPDDEEEEGDLEEAPDGQRQEVLRRFWAQFIDRARHRTPLFANRNPTTDHWLTAGIGRTGFGLNVSMAQDMTRVECYFRVPGDQDGKRTAKAFEQLQSRKAEIEARFGGPLVWQPLPERIGARICKPVYGGWKSPEGKWPDLQGELIELSIRLADALRAPIQAISV